MKRYRSSPVYRRAAGVGRCPRPGTAVSPAPWLGCSRPGHGPGCPHPPVPTAPLSRCSPCSATGKHRAVSVSHVWELEQARQHILVLKLSKWSCLLGVYLQTTRVDYCKMRRQREAQELSMSPTPSRCRCRAASLARNRRVRPGAVLQSTQQQPQFCPGARG